MALQLSAENNYSYSSGTQFIGFTFRDGPDDDPLIDIVGSEDLNSDNECAPIFKNCRFIDTDFSAADDHLAPILIERAEPTFDGCEFRNLNIEASSSFDWNYLGGPIRILGELVVGIFDTTAFRPQFKNCVIAGN